MEKIYPLATLKKRSKGGKYLKDTRIYLGNVKKAKKHQAQYAQKVKKKNYNAIPYNTGYNATK